MPGLAIYAPPGRRHRLQTGRANLVPTIDAPAGPGVGAACFGIRGGLPGVVHYFARQVFTGPAEVPIEGLLPEKFSMFIRQVDIIHHLLL